METNTACSDAKDTEDLDIEPSNKTSFSMLEKTVYSWLS